MDYHDLLMAFAKAASANALDRAFIGHSAVENAAIFIFGFAPIATIFLGSIGLHVIDYVLLDLIPILAMVETPVPGGSGSEKYGVLDNGDESRKGSDKSTMSSPKDYYVTSGIRSTYHHLQAEAGDLSIFRGIGPRLMVNTIMLHLVQIFTWAFEAPVSSLHESRFFFKISWATVVLLFAQIDTAWVHIMTSKPRQKFWFRRLPLTFFSILRYLWIPIIAMEIVCYFADWIPTPWGTQLVDETRLGARGKIQLHYGPANSITFSNVFWPLSRILLSSFATPILKGFVVTPVEAVARRMQASLLPDEDDPIVSMDRAFNGRPSSGILARTESLDLKRACRSIDKPTYIRLVKLNLKVRLLSNVMGLMVMAIVGLQLAAFLGFDASYIFLKMILGVQVKQAEVDGIYGPARYILNMVTVSPRLPNIWSEKEWEAFRNRTGN